MLNSESIWARSALIGALALALSGCGGTDDGISGEEVEDIGTSEEALSAVPFETFKDPLGVGGREFVETRRVIHTRAGYRSFFGHAAPSWINFTTSRVIFYAAGKKPSGGYDAQILRVNLRDDNTLVPWTRLVSPGPSCAVPAVITTPYVLAVAKLPKPPTAVRWRRSDVVEECGIIPEGERCGNAICDPGTQYCCNASCGICAPKGGACTQQQCPPPPPPPTDAGSGDICGLVDCAPGFYCCNKSCSTCVPEGSTCSAEYCEGGGSTDAGAPPPKPPAQCGSVTCGQGTYCCNASCSTCVPEGSGCSAEVCSSP